jgi:hypothetical protein
VWEATPFSLSRIVRFSLLAGDICASHSLFDHLSHFSVYFISHLFLRCLHLCLFASLDHFPSIIVRWPACLLVTIALTPSFLCSTTHHNFLFPETSLQAQKNHQKRQQSPSLHLPFIPFPLNSNHATHSPQQLILLIPPVLGPLETFISKPRSTYTYFQHFV